MIETNEEKKSLLSLSPSVLVPRTNQDYFLHFSHPSPSSKSFSSSSSSLLLLSHCEHRQTTYYSSSGFAILRSSLRFLLADIDDNTQRILSGDHYNASLSSRIQTFSTPILLLMSTNENNLLTNNDSNHHHLTTTTTTNSFFSSSNTKITTSTTAVSNISVFHPSHQGSHRTINLTLLIGCIAGGILLILVLLYAFVKYRNRDEGSYKIDESKNFVPTPHLEQQNHEGCGSILSSSTHHRQKLLTTHGQNTVDSREWYV